MKRLKNYSKRLENYSEMLDSCYGKNDSKEIQNLYIEKINAFQKASGIFLTCISKSLRSFIYIALHIEASKIAP